MPDKLERGYASVANEEYRKGYRDGWRDAMNDEKLDKIEPLRPMNPMEPTPYAPGEPWRKWPDHVPPWNNDQYIVCPKCGGICGPYQVCRTPGCPSYPTPNYRIKTTDNTSE